MTKIALALALALAPLAGIAQDPVKTGPGGKVTIASAGSDVRKLIHEIFTQAGKSYVLEPYLYYGIHLNLVDVPFEDALKIVSKLGKLKYEVQNGIYFFSRDKSVETQSLPTPKPQATKTGRLDASSLSKKLTTRLLKADIRDVFAEFARQTELPIEVSLNVPAYKVDAILINTSLRYSLDVITKAAGLKYRLTDNQSIEVYRP